MASQQRLLRQGLFTVIPSIHRLSQKSSGSSEAAVPLSWISLVDESSGAYFIGGLGCAIEGEITGREKSFELQKNMMRGKGQDISPPVTLTYRLHTQNRDESLFALKKSPAVVVATLKGVKNRQVQATLPRRRPAMHVAEHHGSASE